MKPLKFLIVALLFITSLDPMLQRGNVQAQQIEVIGITDSATVTSKWLGDKVARFMVSGLTNMYLKRQSDNHKDWAEEILSTGFYKFDSVYLFPGIYELYINDVLKQEYGAIKYQTVSSLNDTDYVHTTGATEYIWVTNLYSMGQVQFYNYAPASLVAPTIPSHLVTKQFTEDLHNNDTNLIKSTGSEAIYGVCSFYGLTDFSSQVTFYNNAPETSVSPTLPGHLTNKYYVDDAIASVTVTPFQSSSNHVRIIPDGTEQTSQVYTTVVNGIYSFNSPDDSNQCVVEIMGMGTNKQYIYVDQSAFKDYVHIKGVGKHINLVSGTTTASVTKTMTFENITLFFGANEGLGDRTYNSVSFINCTIYAYDDITFTNCLIQNSIIYNESGENSTYDGYTRILNSNFNQLTTEGGSFTGFLSGMLDGFSTGYSLPTDPSLAP